MKPASFAYHAPTSVADAVCLLAEHAEHDGRILAGGQSLVPAMAFRLARPAHLIDINNVPELTALRQVDGRLTIGATVRHCAFHRPVLDGPLGRILSHVVQHIAHYPIRMRGTFCGSIAHADPASEWCLVAVALDAGIAVRSLRGVRTIGADDFFTGMMTTALAADELLETVSLPIPDSGTRFGFYEFSRRAGDYAIAMAFVSFCLQDGVMRAPCVAIGGAEARPRRLAAAEAVLSQQPPSGKVFRAAGEAASAVLDPLEDIQADAAYRRDLVRFVVRRALEQAQAG